MEAFNRNYYKDLKVQSTYRSVKDGLVKALVNQNN